MDYSVVVIEVDAIECPVNGLYNDWKLQLGGHIEFDFVEKQACFYGMYEIDTFCHIPNELKRTLKKLHNL